KHRTAFHPVQDRSVAVRHPARSRLPRGGRPCCPELALHNRRPVTAVDAVVGPRSGTIPVAGPWITEREVEAVAAAARGSWYEDATGEKRALTTESAPARA